jgi:Arc/MetJ family transcription regulator
MSGIGENLRDRACQALKRIGVTSWRDMVCQALSRTHSDGTVELKRIEHSRVYNKICSAS